MQDKTLQIAELIKKKLEAYIVELSPKVKGHISLILDPVSLSIEKKEAAKDESSVTLSDKKRLASGKCAFIPSFGNRSFPENKLRAVWEKGKVYFDNKAILIFLKQRTKIFSMLNRLNQLDLPYLTSFALQYSPDNQTAQDFLRVFLKRLDISVRESELRELLYTEYSCLHEKEIGKYSINLNYIIAESLVSKAKKESDLSALISYLKTDKSPFKIEEFESLINDTKKILEMESFSRRLNIKKSSKNSKSQAALDPSSPVDIDSLALAIEDLLLHRGLWGLKLIYFRLNYQDKAKQKSTDSELIAESRPIDDDVDKVATLESASINLLDFPYFRIFDDDELLILEKSCQLYTVQKDTLVYSHEQPFPYLCLIANGEVKIERESSYGDIAIAVQKAGDFLGEDYFLNNRLPSNKALTTADSSFYTWELEKLTSHFTEDKFLATKFYWCIWQSLAQKIRIANDELGHFFQQQIALPKDMSPGEVLQRGVAQDIEVDEDTKITALRLKGLSSSEMKLLTSFGREEYYSEGSIIFNEGDKGDSLYIILEGSVRISKQIPGIGEEALAILQKGDYFGEMALIDEQSRSADAKAHNHGVTLLSLTKRDFNEIISSNIDIAEKFINIICRMLSVRLLDLQDKVCQWKVMAGHF